MIDVAVKVLFLRELAREPEPFELDEYVLYSYERAETILRQTPEYLARHDPDYKPEVYYHSGSHVVRVLSPAHAKYTGILVGNGKVCVRTTAHHEMCDRMSVTFKPEASSTTTSEVRKSNLLRTWSALGGLIRRGDVKASDVVLRYEQRLNCHHALFESVYTTKVRVAGIDSTYHVHKTLLAPRQYPYGFYVRYQFTGSTDPFEFDHVWRSFPEDMRSRTISANKVGKRVMVSASAKYVQMNQQDDVEAVATYTLRAIANDGTPTLMDVTLIVNEIDDAHDAARIHNLVIPEGGRLELEIFVSLTSTQDFVRPQIEAARIANSMREDLRLRTNHFEAWKLMWNADVEIDGRSGISSEESTSLNIHRRYHKVNLYTLYSTMRYEAFEGFESLNTLTIDELGDRFEDVEMHLLPVLLVINPTLARIILDYRFEQLEQGKKDAWSHGFGGAYVSHTVSYSDNVYTAPIGIRLHSTALVGIHVWNYFRRTTDREWLLSRGYKIMKHCTRYMLDKLVVTRDDVGRIVSASLVETTDIDGVPRKNLTLVVYTTYVLLKFTIEATYELNYNFTNHQDWIHMHEYFRSVFNKPESMGSHVEISESEIVDTASYQPAVSTPEEENDPGGAPTPLANPIQNAFTTGNRPLPYRVGMRLRNMTLYLDDLTTDPPTPLGFMFGGDSGFKLRLEPESVYTFVLNETTPIEFFDSFGNRMSAAMLLPESTATYNSVIDQGYHSGTVVVTGAYVRSYSSVRAHTVFGINAFTTDDRNTVYNFVVFPYDGYKAMDPVGRSETMLMLSNYYARAVFSNTIINPVGSAGLMLRDNANYFHVVSDMTSSFNQLNYANAYASVAQRDFSSGARASHINVYDVTMLRHFENNTASPWGEDVNYPIGIFSLLDGLMGFNVRGSLSATRYYIEMYSLAVNHSNILPSYWKELRIYTNEQARGRRVYTMFNMLV